MSAGSGVFPLIILGDPNTGYNGEPTRISLAKYNVHDHQSAGSLNFWLQQAMPGNKLFAETECGDAVFSSGTLVNQVHTNKLIANTNALISGVCTVILDTNKIFNNCQVTKDSPNIEFSESLHGFISAENVLTLAHHSISGIIQNAQPNVNYPIHLKSRFSGYVSHIALRSIGGTCDAKLKFQAANLGAIKEYGPYSAKENTDISQTIISPQATANSFLDINNSLCLILTNVSLNVSLAYTVTIIKSLPLTTYA
jgi:hypothetical protein